MAKQPRLHRRGARFYVRVRVPDDLRDIIGRREIKYSLGTADYREALERVRLASATIDGQFAEARRKATIEPTRTLTEFEAEQLVLRWFHVADRKSERTEIVGDVSEAVHDLETDVGDLRNTEDPSTLAAIYAVTQRLLRGNNLELDTSSPEYRFLERLVQRGLVERALRDRDRLRGNHSGRSHDRLFSQTIEAPGIGFKELGRLFLADPAKRHLTAKTVADYRAALSMFQELIGADVPVRSITRETCRDAMGVLLRLPPYARTRFPGLTLRRVADEAERRGATTLTAKGVNNLMGVLSSLLRWAVREDHADRNPAEGLRVTVPAASKRGARLPFSPDQLRLIFQSAPYDDPDAPKGALFWLPLLSLFGGLRMGEAAQLTVDDVAQRDGVPVILVRRGEGRSVKTAAGERAVPIHPELVRIGFLDYARAQREASEARLFPDLPRGASSAFQKRYSRHLRAIKVHTPKTTFHSYRHCATDALREAGVPADRIRAIMGWTGSGMEETVYGGGLRPRTLAREVAKVRYEGLDLSHLHVR